jgi:hypothetical protein
VVAIKAEREAEHHHVAGGTAAGMHHEVKEGDLRKVTVIQANVRGHLSRKHQKQMRTQAQHPQKAEVSSQDAAEAIGPVRLIFLKDCLLFLKDCLLFLKAAIRF